MLTRDDFKEIKKELDDRYVLQSDCNDKQEAVNKSWQMMTKELTNYWTGLIQLVNCFGL